MKIGIISDTHGSVTAWEMAYDKFFHDADLILHAGDVLYHGPRNRMQDDYSPAVLSERLNQCSVPILIARGNCDSEVDASVLDVPLTAPYLFTLAGGRRIVVAHGHLAESDGEKAALANKLRADVFISGHTHIAALWQREGIRFVNPGSPALSKRMDGRQTVAQMDEEKIEILDLYTQEVLERISLEK